MYVMIYLLVCSRCKFFYQYINFSISAKCKNFLFLHYFDFFFANFWGFFYAEIENAYYNIKCFYHPPVLMCIGETSL